MPTGAHIEEVYRTERVGTGVLQYQLSVPDGSYTVTTMHWESYFNVAGKRKFSVDVNGQAQNDVDIFDRVGRDVALDFTFKYFELNSAGGKFLRKKARIHRGRNRLQRVIRERKAREL